MADFAVTGTQDFSFSNANTGWVTASCDMTSCTWGCLIMHDFFNNAGAVATLTYAKFNGGALDILPGLHANAATANRTAGILGLIPFALGANAGNHTFEFRWPSGSLFQDAQIVFGTGDIDAAVVDGAFVDNEHTGNGTTATPAAYTPTTNKALPIIAYSTADLTTSGLNQSANCTFQKRSGLDGGVAIFTCPLSTPAGTATSAVMTNTNAGHNLAISIALKPAGAGPGGFVGTGVNALRAGYGSF